MLINVSGIFVKIIFTHDLDIQLHKGSETRPPGRYNRPGQDALYLSRNTETAMIAMRKYVKDTDPPRVLIHFEVTQCEVVDLRHPVAEEYLTGSRNDWLEIYSRGGEPSSWRVADRIREQGYEGLIDPSRNDPNSWHLVLFQWNEGTENNVKLSQSPISLPLDLG